MTFFPSPLSFLSSTFVKRKHDQNASECFAATSLRAPRGGGGGGGFGPVPPDAVPATKRLR